jgi:hypothetical protein
MYLGIFKSTMSRLFCFAPGAFHVALGLLSHVSNLEFGILGQLTRLTLDASSHLVDSSIHSIFVPKPTYFDLSPVG